MNIILNHYKRVTLPIIASLVLILGSFLISNKALAAGNNVLFYRFNEPIGSHIAKDSSGFGNRGTCLKNQGKCPLFGQAGVSSTAVFFDGQNDFISAVSTSSLSVNQNISIEVWLKPSKVLISTNTPYYVIASKGLSYQLGTTGKGEIQAVINPVGKSTQYFKTSGNVVTVGVWNHIVMTYNGSAVQIYKDGALVQSFPLSGAIKTNSMQLVVGGYQGKNFYSGFMDELKIYNKALTATQVLNNYNKNKPVVIPANDLQISKTVDSAVGLLGPGASNAQLAKFGLTVGTQDLEVKKFKIGVKYSGTPLVGNLIVRNAMTNTILGTYSASSLQVSTTPMGVNNLVEITLNNSLTLAAGTTTIIELLGSASFNPVYPSSYQAYVGSFTVKRLSDNFVYTTANYLTSGNTLAIVP